MPQPRKGNTPDYPFNGRAPFVSQQFRWEVLWEKGEDIYTKQFHCDLASALKFFLKMKDKGRANVTLRSAAHGFPPPEHLTHHEYIAVVLKRGKRYRVRKTKNVMGDLNAKGIWWCCYCMKLRRFERRLQGSEVGGITVEYDSPRMCCPTCGATSSDFNIGQCNPDAQFVRLGKKRRRKKKRGKRISRG